MGMRLQGTQAEHVVPWMLPLSHRKISGDGSGLGHPDTPVVGCSDSPQHIGRGFGQLLQEDLAAEKHRCGGINPQQDS